MARQKRIYQMVTNSVTFETQGRILVFFGEKIHDVNVAMNRLGAMNRIFLQCLVFLQQYYETQGTVLVFYYETQGAVLVFFFMIKKEKKQNYY
jgi:hypothetical protein